MIKRPIFLVFIAAFLVRLISLNQSLWLDEATTAQVVQQYSFSQIITQFSPQDFHPPLYYLFMKVWTSIFGNSEVALRMPSVLFSLITGWVIYLIGRKLEDENVAIWAAVFFLFNPLIIYYSQEARMYMLVTLFITSILYFCLRSNIVGIPSSSATPLIILNLFILCSLLTFYGSIFFIAALYLYLIVKREFRILLLIIPGFFIAGIMLYPLFVQQFSHSQIATSAVSNWKQVLGPASLKNLLLFPIKFTSGRISFEPKVVYYSLSIIWAAIIFFISIKSKKYFLTALFVAPIIFGVIISFYSPLLQYFRFIYVLPILAMLLAIGTRYTLQRQLLLIGFLWFSLIYLLLPQFHREDWKLLGTSLSSNATVYMIPSSADPLKYYNKDIDIRDIRQLNGTKREEVVVIPYTSDIHGIDYKSILKRQNFSLNQTKTVRGLSYEIWKRN